MKCKECSNYLVKLDTCKFCHFESKDPKSCENCKYFIDSMFGDCRLGNLNDENIINEDGVMKVNCMEWERKE